jgi:4'-phosphopantetheinyl transferase
MTDDSLADLHGSLPTDTVDVWHLSLTEDRADWDLLNSEERERAKRLLFIDKRVQFVAARSQIRQILASYQDCRPEAVAFDYGPHGKPSIQNTGGPWFNLSHSRDAGILAVAQGPQLNLGIDIESRKPGRRFEAIAKRFFSTAEHQAFQSLDTTDYPTGFYRAWTHKEAYLKACGTGLSFPSSQFTLAFTGPGTVSLLHTEMPDHESATWHFHDIESNLTCSAALCYSGAPRWIRHFVAPLAALPNNDLPDLAQL